MPFNWFTFIAQIVNFTILVWLLKRFLYKPILQIMEERQLKVMTELREAERKRVEADEERQKYVRLQLDFDRVRDEKLNLETKEAQERREKVIQEAVQEIQSMKAQWNKELEHEKEQLRKNIVTIARKEVFDLTRQVLMALSESSLEELICKVFLRRLQHLSLEENQIVSNLCNASTEKIYIRSSFDLSPEAQDQMRHCIENETKNSGRLLFQVVPELICGVELIIGSLKISWNISDYITSLEGKISGVVDQGKMGDA
ncbi:MAG: hypothetical protein HQM09_00365 [Candidatus Riflebacteria bacterium]|nr:hypothetical protein [Candidatus Riflebacteria bacterium]